MSLVARFVVAAFVALCFCGPARAQGTPPAAPPDVASPFSISIGANGVWLNGPDAAFPADFEGTVGGAFSASPHLSAVGSAAYGFSQNYLRWDAGFRVTATDVEDPNFNVYLGARLRGGSIGAVQPTEWAPDAGFGWKPSPKSWPRLVLGADAGYGLASGDKNVGALDSILRQAGERLPDLKPEIDPIIAALGSAVSASNLAALGPEVLKEALHIAQGKLDPRRHAGDSI